MKLNFINGTWIYGTSLKLSKPFGDVIIEFQKWEEKRRTPKSNRGSKIVKEKDIFMEALASLLVLNPTFYAAYLKANEHQPEIEILKRMVSDLLLKTEHFYSQKD